MWGPGRGPFCDGATRRTFLQVGALALGGLSLADLLRSDARGEEPTPSRKSVIMVYLPGGPSHLDLYDMKPDAPVEIRGEFRPIKSNVPGLDLCELLPLQAGIADKLAVVRGFKTLGGHDSQIITTGFPTRPARPAFGSVVSRLRPTRGAGLRLTSASSRRPTCRSARTPLTWARRTGPSRCAARAWRTSRWAAA